MTTEDNNSIIIVGGGPGGIRVARTIVQQSGKTPVSITVMDRQNYMDWSLASPRSLVHPEDILKYGYVMPLDKVCEHVSTKKHPVKFIQANVTQVSPTSVTLDNGTVLEAKVIVVAIGGQYASGAMWKPLPDQITKETRIAAFKTLRAKVEACHSIVVTGAGPTGVEVAGEIKAAFPNITVTIVGTLLPHSKEPIQERTKATLESLGIVVMTGHVDVTEPDVNGSVMTREGETIHKVDMILNAAGFTFAGAKIANDALKQDVTPNGQFSCRPTLQLQSIDSVFCCGDILAVPDGCFADVKGLQHADDTATAVGKNVLLLLQQKPLLPFQWHTTMVDKPMMTALGPKVGLGYMGLPHFMENFMCRSFKCKDYYMGLKGSLYGKGKTW